MKKVLLSVWTVVIMCLSVAAQQSELIAFTGESNIGKLSKEDVFKKMLAWHRQNMPKEALKEVNESKGELKGTSFLNFSSTVTAAGELTQGFIIYDFKVIATDNGFQYEITNFRHEAKIKFHTLTTHSSFPYKIDTVEKPWYDLVWKDLKAHVNQQVPKMIANMTEVVKNEADLAQLREKSEDELITQFLKSSSN